MDYTTALQTLQASDRHLAQLIEQVGECRLHHSIQPVDLFYALSESIIYQQLSGKAAGTIHRRFLQLFSDPEVPTAAEVLTFSEEQLRGVGLSRSKALYIKDLAAKSLTVLPSIEALKEMDDEAIITTVTEVKGVGRWTAQMLLMFRLHRWDVWPTDDLGIRAGIKKLYSLEELPAKKRLDEYGDRWKPYRTIACWYLWRSLELKP